MVWIRSWSFMVTITVVASRWTFVVTVLHRRAEKMYKTIKSTWPEVCFTNQCHVHIAPDEFLTGWKFWQDTLFIRDRQTREQNRNNKRTEIERFDWFIERIQTRVAFGWLSERLGETTSCPELSRNLLILRFDFILQHNWPIEQCLLHIRVWRENEESMFSSLNPLADKINNEHLTKPVSRLYQNRSIFSLFTRKLE